MATDMQFVDFTTPVPADWLNNVNDNVQNIFPITYYGAKCDGVTDDTVAIQAAINAAQAVNRNSGEGPTGRVIGPPGCTIKTTAPLVISSPIQFYIPSYIYYYGTTGSAIVAGTNTIGTNNYGYDIYIQGLRKAGDNTWTSAPTYIDGSQIIGSISGNTLTVTANCLSRGRIAVGHVVTGQGVPENTVITALGTGTGGVGTYTLSTSSTVSSQYMNCTANVGFEVRSMQFSRIRIEEIIGFRTAGFWGNSTNDHTSLQHVQDCDILLGQIAYNGAGVYLNSADAAYGAYQANYTQIQNSFSNFVNIQVDTGYGTGPQNASSSNHIRCNALDGPAEGGLAMEWNSQYSMIESAYLGGPVVFGATSANTELFVANNFSTAASFFDGGNGTNWMRTGSPNAEQLPASFPNPPASPIQNSFGVPVIGYCVATVTQNPSAATNVFVWVGSNADTNFISVLNIPVPAGTGTVTIPLTFAVPPMHYWQINSGGAGSVAFSQVNFQRVA